MQSRAPWALKIWKKLISRSDICKKHEAGSQKALRKGTSTTCFEVLSWDQESTRNRRQRTSTSTISNICVHWLHLRTVHRLQLYFDQCALYSCLCKSDCLALNYVEFEYLCILIVVSKIRKTLTNSIVYRFSSHRIESSQSWKCSNCACTDVDVFIISSSNSSALFPNLTKFVAIHKPRFSNADVSWESIAWGSLPYENRRTYG